MRKTETLSTRFEDFTITRKKSAKAVVMNEFTALEALKKARPEYVIEAISSQALKEVEKGSLALDGVTVEEKEFVSIRQAKQEESKAA